MRTRTRQPHRARKNPYFEFLEARTLMTATVTSYLVADVSPSLAAYDSNGSLWVVNTSFASGHQTLDELVNGALGRSIIIDDVSANSLVAGAGGHLWIADANGGLTDVDTNAETYAQHLFVTDTFTDFANVPVRLTVSSSGNVWFIGAGNPQATFTDNVVGRYDPVLDTVSYLTLDNSTNDATALYISANGSDGAWLGMPGTDFGDHVGANHLASLSFSGSIGATYYAVQTLNAVPDAAVADAGNPISGIASDGSGGVWFSLANSTATTAPHGADRLVHGVINGANLDQTAYVLDGATVGNPETVANVAVDSNGDVWFNTLTGTVAGTFDTTTHTFTFHDYPAGVTTVSAIVVNPAANQASFIAFDDGSIVQIDVTDDVTFDGDANNLAGQEGHVFNSTLLATFVAPPPGTGSYSAVITWGDSTTSTVSVSALGDNTYAVVISGKSFASQGTYNGTITIKDSANVVAGTMTFQSVISDTPLTVTSFTTIPLVLRIVTATAMFTDDPGRPASSFSATINWGDSTSSTGLIVADPTQAGRYLVVALHRYRSRGTYTAKITVTTTEAGALINVNQKTSTVTV